MPIRADIRLFAALLALIPAAAGAQQGGPIAPNDSAARARALRTVTITATRHRTDVHDVATPVSVLDSGSVRERTPNNAADLLRELPGVDVIGVGPNQNRPSIRGQRGQRILLLEDGLRLNNARRQQDFGELPSLVDVSSVERVEVVRGPASVLYGTDAIGGVINLITLPPAFGTGAPAMNGRLAYRYGSSGAQDKGEAALAGRAGEFAWRLGGTWRNAGDYDAPAGHFGNLRLASDVTVVDAGVKDHGLQGALGWHGATGMTATLKLEQYVANDAGFGYVPNSLLGGDGTKIQIRYPHQDFRKLTLGASSGALALAIADRIEVAAYTQRNQRDLAQDIFIPFGPGTGMKIQTGNYTDVATVGTRVEATKVMASAVLTYGFDAFQDRSYNTDTSTTSFVGIPAPSQASHQSQVPNAVLSSVGEFAQVSFSPLSSTTLSVGGRLQQVSSEPRFTPGIAAPVAGHSVSTGVWAVSGLVRVTDALNVVASAGRAFRAPNLVERYFDGPTPEGSAYEKASPNLAPETSINVDLGLKYRIARFVAEATVFENNISDAITLAPTGDTLNRLPIYQNVNVGKLRARGAEVGATWMLPHGVSAGGNWSTIKATNVLNPAVPIGDTFSNKLNLSLGWAPNARCWAEYAVRRNGEQKDITAGTSPVGNVLPAFTVHTIRGGFRGWMVGRTRQDLTVTINNLTNVLYAEAANSSFFRPEPKRNVVVAIATAF